MEITNEIWGSCMALADELCGIGQAKRARIEDIVKEIIHISKKMGYDECKCEIEKEKRFMRGD